ncbi:MAG: transglutaminase domain-containing protein [bacterium]
MKKLLTLVLALYFFGTAKIDTYAQETAAFVSDYNINITVDNKGQAHYQQVITVTNQTVDYYLKNYSVSLGLDEVENIKVLDGLGKAIPYELVNEEETTTLTLSPQGVVGVGNKNVFDISFETGELAKKRGLMWEIIIPGIKASPNLGQYNLVLNIPQDFGPPTTTPAKTAGGFYSFSYQKNDLLEKGQIINLGLYQLYDFTITYALRNPNMLSTVLPVTLPPAIPNVQKVFFSKIDPAPEKYEQDPDGNQIAHFLVSGGKTITPVISGQIMVFSNINTPAEKESNPNLPYTNEDEFWQVQNPEILKIAAGLDTPKSAYQYTVNHISYKQVFPKDEIVRQGALYALENGEGVCTEFSDLLVTLLRAKGIAAQSLAGFAYSEESSYIPKEEDDRVVLHSWVRWFDKHLGWQYTDPTWGATTGLDYFEKLDTNHVVFAIHGQSSVTPYSAGAYVEGSATLKDKVAVTFATKESNHENLTTFETLKADWSAKEASKTAIWKRVFAVLALLASVGFFVIFLGYLRRLTPHHHLPPRGQAQ